MRTPQEHDGLLRMSALPCELLHDTGNLPTPQGQGRGGQNAPQSVLHLD